MNIAIIAQNRKKELMVQFCIAYCGLLAKHNLCATATTGKMIIDATGLKIDDLLRSCDQHCIPVATNVATAEVLIQGLARGDLAWREIDPKATF